MWHSGGFQTFCCGLEILIFHLNNQVKNKKELSFCLIWPNLYCKRSEQVTGWARLAEIFKATYRVWTNPKSQRLFAPPRDASLTHLPYGACMLQGPILGSSWLWTAKMLLAGLYPALTKLHGPSPFWRPQYKDLGPNLPHPIKLY